MHKKTRQMPGLPYKRKRFLLFGIGKKSALPTTKNALHHYNFNENVDMGRKQIVLSPQGAKSQGSPRNVRFWCFCCASNLAF